MKFYITLSIDGSPPVDSMYYYAYEIDERFHAEVSRVVVGLVESGRAKGL